MKVLQLAGYKKSGKTALAQALVARAVKRGELCAVIKNTHGELGLTGKDDGERFLASGSREAILFRNGLTDTLTKTEGLMDLIRKALGRYDLLIVEGFKEVGLPRIWCGEKESPDEEKGILLARFSLDPVKREPKEGEKCLQGLGEETLATVDRLIESLPPFPAGLDCGLCGSDCLHFYCRGIGKKDRACPVQEKEKSVTITVNAKELSLMPFVQSLFRETVKGFVKELKGYEEGTLEITIHHQTKEDKK
ncbi:MAG TPA: molybdopterin-guanine dinucleotide biosynthesis protein MobB [Candidatus Mcinerneyibacteriales bacterium]|nr:molybdopterin-guanine dinucleotide biosynthesis protein MobB [Candidatus Mcinerneyibacteriales bacterium]